ncbi:MAG: DUF2177 family protein [Coxiellaceae bacterium]|nr:DUF2177 family protein [Coxiellaceae bacterium]
MPFLIALFCMICLDLIWFALIARQFYFQQLGNILRLSEGKLHPHYPAAIMVYILLALGIVYFVLPKTQGSLFYALLFGALFGLITYGVYDFTNLATLQNWSLKVTLVDAAWGMFTCAVTSVVTLFLTRQ